MTTVAEIAAGLTKAQREALANARETFLYGRMKIASRSKVLRGKGISVEAWRGGDLLTPLGEAVAAHLKNKDA